MAETEHSVTTILTRDRSSGRVHARYVVDGSTQRVDERCNLDQAGAFDVIESIEGVDPGDLCQYDFPAIERD